MHSRTVLCAAALLAASCSSGGGSGGTQPVSTVASVSVSQDATLVPQATVQLTATPKDASGAALAGQTVGWSSSNPAVATVSSGGLVTAVSVGSAIVTATSGGKSGTATMTVVDGGIVGAAGGTVTAIQGAVKLTVPAGALSASTALTVAAVTVAETDPRLVPGTIFEIGPSGTQFGAGATMSLAYDPAKVRAIDRQSDLRLFTKNATTGVWAPLNASGTGSADTVAHIVTGPLPHLTRFGVASPLAVQTVNSATLAGLPLGQPFTNTLLKGPGLALVATTTNAYGQPVGPSGTPTVTSSDATVVSVSNVGKATGGVLGVAFTLTGVNTGAANITVVADGENLTVPVTVTGPSLSIALSSSSLTTPQGTAANGSATVTITQNYSAPVTLTDISVTPLNVTGSFTPALVPAGTSTSSLGVNASGFLAPGAYALTVTAASTPPGTATPLQATATYTVNVTATAGSIVLSSADQSRPFIDAWTRSSPTSPWTAWTCTNNACPITYSPSATALSVMVTQQTGLGMYHNYGFNLHASEMPYLAQYLAGETSPSTTATWAGTNLQANYTFTGVIGGSKMSATTPSYTLNYTRVRGGYQDVLGFESSAAGLKYIYPIGQRFITPGFAVSPLDLSVPGVTPQSITMTFSDPFGLGGTLSYSNILDYRDGSGFAELFAFVLTGSTATIGTLPAAWVAPNRVQGVIAKATNLDGSSREAKLFFAAPNDFSLALGPAIAPVTYSNNTIGATTLDYSYTVDLHYNLYSKIEQKDLTGNYRATFLSTGLYNGGAAAVNFKVSDLPSLYWSFSSPPNTEVDFTASWYGLTGGTLGPSSALGGPAPGTGRIVATSLLYKF